MKTNIRPSGRYLSVTDGMRYVNVSVHTALDELHVVLCQSPCLVRKHVLHLERQWDQVLPRGDVW